MSDAQFSVTNFSSKISTMGLASPNKFEVVFRSIPGQQDKKNLEQLSIMCDQVSLAGRDVQAVLDLQYGIRRQDVYNAPAYTPLSLSFLCTDNMEEKRILDKWNKLRQIRQIAPTIKRYRFDHIMRKVIPIEEDEQEIAIFLPTERFRKSGKAKVWSESERKFG